MTGPPAARRLAAFAAGEVSPPALARARAAAAIVDTVGVTLAGADEPASHLVRTTIAGAAASAGDGSCAILGTNLRARASDAALANGTAAHALDFDDMCFVSLAHPSAPLAAAVLAAGERAGASGTAVIDAYITGFEIEARIGRAINPQHYQRGWHCTSTLGSLGAAAAASRLLGLDADRTAVAIAIAASMASGLKENFGTMVKPLHAGLAARAGIEAAELALAGFSASEHAIDGAQGFIHAMDGPRRDVSSDLDDLGSRWEIAETGITVKLYPSCAGTHPALDAVLDLRREAGFVADDVREVRVGVDAITPTILLYDRPASGLEAKFSMPFCIASAIVHGRVGIDSFEDTGLSHADVLALMPRVTMEVDRSLDASAPSLTQSKVRIVLRDGRALIASANGARGYPTKPATDADLDAKFLGCASRVLSADAAARALAAWRDLATATDIRALVTLLTVKA